MRTAKTKAHNLWSSWKWKGKKCCTYGFSSLLLHDGGRKMVSAHAVSEHYKPHVCASSFSIIIFVCCVLCSPGFIYTLPQCISSDLADLDLSWWMSARYYDCRIAYACPMHRPRCIISRSGDAFAFSICLPKRCNSVAETQFSFQLWLSTFCSVNRVFLLSYINWMLGRRRRICKKREQINRSWFVIAKNANPEIAKNRHIWSERHGMTWNQKYHSRNSNGTTIREWIVRTQCNQNGVPSLGAYYT